MPRLTTLAALAVALVACSDSDKSGDTTSLDIAFPDAPDGAEVSQATAFVALCDGFAKACCAVERCVEPGAQEQDDCYQATRGYCEDVVETPIESQIGPGTVRYSETAAGACLAYYLGGNCGDSTQFETPPAACEGIFEGTATAGAACPFDAVCAPGLFCKPIANACPGTCAARGGEGATCNGVDALCREDLVCTDDDGGTCVAPKVAAGAACVLTSQCPPEQYCSTSEGKCVPDKVAGDACPEGSGCAAGLTCDFGVDPPSCVRLPTLDEACDRSCAFPALCDRTAKKCVPAPEVGDACIDANAPCGYHRLECNATTQKCEALGGIGSACGGDGNDTNCADSYCDGDFQTAGTCLTYKRLGDPCEGFGQCGPRLTCTDGTCQKREHPCRSLGTLACF